ncbi:MAG: response regulator [Spirochaetota bacterium]
MRRTTLVLVDDHPPLRTGVAAILERSLRYEVVGEAGTLSEAMDQIRDRQPELVIVDVSLPDGSGIDFVRTVKRDALVSGALVLTMHARRALADSAFEAGADGYLLKESTSEHLVIALDAIMRGEAYLDAALELVRAVRDGCGTGAENGAFRRLSEREFEVFRLLAGGQNSKQIAAMLGISSKTVDNHRASIMAKLDLDSIADLVRLAIRTGELDP